MRILNLCSIVKKKDNYSPSEFERKEEAQGNEWWSDKFVYPNNWTLHSRRTVVLKDNPKTNLPFLFFGPENPLKLFGIFILVLIILYIFRK